MYLYKMCVELHTLNVSSIDRNLRLSPMSIALLMQGNCVLTSSSITAGAMFSPPAVIINSCKHYHKYKINGDNFTMKLMYVLILKLNKNERGDRRHLPKTDDWRLKVYN